MKQDWSQEIDRLKQEVQCPKSLALRRMKLLEGSSSSAGFPSYFLPLLRESLQAWTTIVRSAARSEISLEAAIETKSAVRVLRICKNIAEMDPTLDEELAREGAHILLSKIIKVDSSSLKTEENQDCVMEIQDMACEIAAMSKSFPLRVAPFTNDELCQRLPLSFPILPVSTTTDAAGNCKIDSKAVEESNGALILINQVTERQSAQKDVGFVMWPSAVVLSRWLVSNPSIVDNKSILEIGAGCGLTGLVAARLQQIRSGRQVNGSKTSSSVSVTLTDFNETVVKNIQQNIFLNDLEGVALADGLDFYKQDVALASTAGSWLDTAGQTRPPVDLILAADVICQPEDAYAAARTIFVSLRPGGQAIVVSGDSKHRFGVEQLEGACLELGLKVDRTDVRDLYEGRLISCDMEKTSGYVEGMSLTMYTVTKYDHG